MAVLWERVYCYTIRTIAWCISCAPQILGIQSNKSGWNWAQIITMREELMSSKITGEEKGEEEQWSYHKLLRFPTVSISHIAVHIRHLVFFLWTNIILLISIAIMVQSLQSGDYSERHFWLRNHLFWHWDTLKYNGIKKRFAEHWTGVLYCCCNLKD